jgi:peptide deformylase
MSVLPICTYPDPVLRQKAERVESIDDSVQRLIDDMIDTMYNAPGIGLAANQVGRLLSVLVVDIQREESDLIVLINPEIISSRGKTISEEGCLSVPEYFAKVTRHEEVVVRGVDRHGENIEIAAGGLLAIALQHEMDHLEGRLFIDRMNTVARDIFKRRWKKKLREEKEEEQPWAD